MWTRIVRYYFLPPGIFVVMALVGWWLLRRRPRVGRAIVTASFVLLYLCSLNWVSYWLHRSLEVGPSLLPDEARHSGAGAIVVLAAGMRPDRRELGYPALEDNSLIRVFYGVHLHRVTGLPLVFSGGATARNLEPLAPAMAQTAMEMGVKPENIWLELRSRTTFENARFSRELLAEKGIKRILLVTQSWHMWRSVFVFERGGLEVVPAPCDHVVWHPNRNWAILIPNARNLQMTSVALEEWLGNLVYRLRY